jgi:hypothetical protein
MPAEVVQRAGDRVPPVAKMNGFLATEMLAGK